jgi:hypothetical protein
MYARQKIEAEKKKVINEDRPFDQDVYSTKLPLLE